MLQAGFVINRSTLEDQLVPTYFLNEQHTEHGIRKKHNLTFW